MRKQLLLLLLTFLMTAPVLAQQTKPTPTPTPTPEEIIEDDEPLKIEADVVNTLFTATDKDRRFLTNLTKGDVKIYEDDKPQEIFAFQRQVDLPLSLAILIDTSSSQERTLPEEKTAAMAFVEDVIRENKDEVAVLTFTGEATLEQGLTGNISRLRRAIEKIKFIPPSGYAGGGVVIGSPPISGRNQAIAGSTAIWDAIYVTSDEVLRDTPEQTRRAIILMSDGVNTYGGKFDDAVKQALKNDVVIYSVGIGDNFYSGVDERSLKQVSEKTGGRAFFPRNELELQRAFAQIQIELRSQYLIAYQPTNERKDGSYRNIKIEITNPDLQKQKAKLTYRQGYFAKAPTPNAPKK
ncbi:MAG: VWA domain-containing protein [Pyrinomonadaceae bacterium]|nr:VWA domain-containing protein [Pyrinomonadaceae bacterium]